MRTHTSSDERATHAPAWSPETETREDVKALLCKRDDGLTPDEIKIFRFKLFPDMYDTYVETLRCVVRSHGARDAVDMELVHQTLTDFWDQTLSGGFPDSIQAKLLALAMGLARNHVRRDGRDPAKAELPTSSKEVPLSGPKVDFDLKEAVRVLFERLSPEHHKMVEAVVLRDLPVKAAARELGLPRRTARGRLTAAMTLLGEWFDEILPPSEQGIS